MASNTFAAPRELGMMAWGINTDQGKRIGVNEIRVGCYRGPEYCLKNISSLPLDGIRKVSIAFVRHENAGNAIRDAQLYSAQAGSLDVVRELSIDDFFDFASTLPRSAAADYLGKTIDAVKGASGKLDFGITVYEDELLAISSSQDIFPFSVRGRIDRVALYLHYRNSVKKYAELIDLVRGIFPNAKLYLGVYNYDRRDYISCGKSTGKLCTDSDELSLFSLAFREQMNLFRQGKVDGLEFYPGNFGNEDSWEGWKDDRLCSRSRKKACVRNSVEMNSNIIKEFK